MIAINFWSYTQNVSKKPIIVRNVPVKNGVIPSKKETLSEWGGTRPGQSASGAGDNTVKIRPRAVNRFDNTQIKTEGKKSWREGPAGPARNEGWNTDKS
jgi:hypothetical protein